MFLIDDRYLTENTNVSSAIKDKTMKVALQTVTIINVKPLLGMPLYALYEDHVQNDTPLSAKQTELFTLIQYYMAMRVERELLYNVLNVNNKGVTVEEQAASMDVIAIKRQDLESKADFVRNAILTFLEDNREDFPEFYPEATTPAVRSASAYSSSIVFDPEPKRYFM